MSEPSIVGASLAAAHDGLAEVTISLRYPNGAERSMSLPCESVDRALDTAGIATLDDLVGRPWTVLLADSAEPRSTTTALTTHHS